MMSRPEIREMDALNYPYIRVRDVDWLKRTLLLFPHVRRMTPMQDAPQDAPEIRPFTETWGTRRALLSPADLWSPHVHDAQLALIDELEALFQGPDGQVLLRRFMARRPRPWDQGEASKAPTLWERRLSGGASFQIHRRKVHPDLTGFLQARRLAWTPEARDADGDGYLEMNPRLGEAIMATLALACAEDQGLRVVTEFPGLHGRLAGAPRDAILEACARNPQKGRDKPREQIAEFLVYRRCDVDLLTAERIAALKNERDALVAFRVQLEELAAQLPAVMHNKAELQDRLNEGVNSIFRAWRQDQMNLSRYARALFGAGALEDPIKAAGDLVKGLAKPENMAGLAASGTAHSMHAPRGHTLLQVAGDAAFGFIVAYSIRAVRIWREQQSRAKTSAYRYLTALQNQGVSFSMVA